MFWRLGHVIIKYFTEILWLWYFCPIFSILKIVLNGVWRKIQESVFLRLFMMHWNISLKRWHLKHFLKITSLIVFFLTIAFARPQINVKKSYREKWQAKWAIKPIPGRTFLEFASRFSDFRGSFNPIQTAFRGESIKVLEFNAAI